MKIKKVLITGAEGFIGSHLTEKCVELGWDVKAFIQYNFRNNWGWLDSSKYKKDIQIISGDVRDYNIVYDAVKDRDTVFHLAALIGIPYSYVSPLEYINTNITGTYNVLQASKLSKVKNLIVTSTSEIYGTAQYVPIDEKHPSNAQSPYAATKIGADQLAVSFFNSFNLPVKIARPFNVYGPRQSARAIIPSVVSQILNGKKTIKIGNVTPTRDFTFVKDTADGFIAIAKSNKFLGEAVNIGSGREISVKDLVLLIGELMGEDIKIKTDTRRTRSSSSEVERLLCDNSKLLKHTSWKPRHKLKDGLQETIAWLKDNLHLYKHDIYNI